MEEEDFELIENLHLLSINAINIKLESTNISQLIHFDEYFWIEDFLDIDSYLFQNNLLKAGKNKINIILNNLDKAILTNCNNLIDLSKYSFDDKFGYSIVENPEIKNISNSTLRH